MIREINFTGRHSLDGCYKVIARKGPQSDPRWTLDVELLPEEIDKFGLPEDSVCEVDVYLGSRQERFMMGEGEQKNRYHDSFKTKMSNDVYFKVRLKVVSASDPDHKILAAKRQIVPETVDMNGTREPLLPVRYDGKRLGSLPWSLFLDDELNQARPVLYVHPDLHHSDDGVEQIVKREPLFAALVLPEAMRQILTLKLIVQKEEELDKTDPWVRFIAPVAEYEKLVGMDVESRKKVIDEAVQSFCHSKDFLNLDQE